MIKHEPRTLSKFATRLLIGVGVFSVCRLGMSILDEKIDHTKEGERIDSQLNRDLKDELDAFIDR